MNMCAYFFPDQNRPCASLFGTVRLLIFDPSSHIPMGKFVVLKYVQGTNKSAQFSNSILL